MSDKSKACYIHYGHSRFIPEHFNEIHNEICFPKPSGGLWASDINAPHGWKDWCSSADFGECDIRNSFQFVLTENANVLHIRSKEDFDSLPKQDYNGGYWVPDFEEILRSGVDAIELHLSSDYRLNDALYAWDCDCILIMNKNVIRIADDGWFQE